MVARRPDKTPDATGADNPLVRALAERDQEVEELKKRVQELEASGGRFLSDATHAVRTPLTVILSYLEILQADLTTGLGDEQLSFLGVVWDNVVRLRILIDNLAELAALETQTAQLDPAPSDIAPLIEEGLAERKPDFSRAGLEVAATIDSALPPVGVDPSVLMSAVQRLIDNAVQFTPAGGEIALRVGQTDDRLVIEIEDTGLGIPPDQIDEAFCPFVQLHRQPGRQREGYGLGLPIARRIVEAFGGSLDAQSAVGEGSTFRIQLPVWSEKD